jgi:predicted metal-dependent HD superfamily phosphohydrolase
MTNEITRTITDKNEVSFVIALTTKAHEYYNIMGEVRFYHNYEHASIVTKAAHTLTNNEPSLALLIAAIWHDAVYFPNAGSDANERCSSAALCNEARKIARSVELSKETKDAVNKAQDLIEYTAVKYHMHETRIGGELAILLDADLSSLAVPYSRFVDNQHNIIRENGGVVNPENCKKSAEFLVQLSKCRKYIYHTDKARELWEDKAQSNILDWRNVNDIGGIHGDEED